MDSRLLTLSCVLCWAAACTSPGPSPACDRARRSLDSGAYELAEGQARECVASASGRRHVASFDAARNLLVEALHRNGRAGTAESLSLAEQAVSSMRGSARATSPDAAVPLHNLGVILHDRGEFARALPLHREAHDLRRRGLPSDDPRLADSLDHLALTLVRLERFDEARAMLDQSMAIRERHSAEAPSALGQTLEQLATVLRYAGDYPGALARADRAVQLWRQLPEHPSIASALHARGDVRFVRGDMHAAQADYMDALAIAEKTLRTSHPAVARYLRKVALSDSVFGDLSRARALRERALAIGEASVTGCHPDLPAYLNDLALSVWYDGDYVRAQRLYERALAHNERCLGVSHSLTATVVHNLGSLLADMGDAGEAERLQQRAARDWSAALGPNHPYVATALDALAEVVESRGRHEDARTHYERALATRLEALGTDHPDIAWTLASLARVKSSSGDLQGARNDVAKALAIYRRIGTSDQPDRLARLLIQEGDLERIRGSDSAARTSYSNALTTRVDLFGPAHPLVGEARARLAEVDIGLGAYEHALEEALAAEQIGRDHLRFIVRYLPERQGLAYADKRPRGVDAALSVAARLPRRSLPLVLDALIRSRGVILDELANRAMTTRETGPRPSALDEVVQARQRFANLMVRSLQESVPRALLEEALQAKEQAERLLAEQSAEAQATRARSSIGLADIRRTLPPDAALVSFVQYSRTTPGGASPSRVLHEPSMAAFVLRADGGDVAVVDLGAASTIEHLVTRWRADVAGPSMTGRSIAEADRAYRATGHQLRQAIWDPLTPYLKHVNRVFVVPDGAISLVAMGALPAAGRAFLLEQGPTMHYLSAERDLVLAGPGRQASSGGVLALGGPAFDVGPVVEAVPTAPASALRSANAACGSLQAIRFQPLDGTLLEVKELSSLWRPILGTGRLLVGRDASERAFKGEASKYRILHLATHGFFLDSSCAPTPLVATGGTTRGVGGLASVSRVENPLRLSGLALAGANRRAEARPDEDDGILTAEEVATLDLSGVEWAVLSACDTGVGEIKAGEGVFGLRRAFQVAGARTVIMSLWSVEDQATRAWMRALYEGRFQRNLSTADAVHQASLSVLQDRRARGLSTHPFYWAAFVAAGDWR